MYRERERHTFVGQHSEIPMRNDEHWMGNEQSLSRVCWEKSETNENIYDREKRFIFVIAMLLFELNSSHRVECDFLIC